MSKIDSYALSAVRDAQSCQLNRERHEPVRQRAIEQHTVHASATSNITDAIALSQYVGSLMNIMRQLLPLSSPMESHHSARTPDHSGRS